MADIVLIPHGPWNFGVVQDRDSIYITCYMCGTKLEDDHSAEVAECRNCEAAWAWPEDTYHGGKWIAEFAPIDATTDSTRMARWLHNWLKYEVEVTIE